MCRWVFDDVSGCFRLGRLVLLEIVDDLALCKESPSDTFCHLYRFAHNQTDDPHSGAELHSCSACRRFESFVVDNPPRMSFSSLTTAGNMLIESLPIIREPRMVWVGVITLEQKCPLAIVSIKC